MLSPSEDGSPVPEDAPYSETSPTTGTVLLLSRSDILRRELRQTLAEDQTFALWTTGHLQEAVEALEARSIELVCLDVGSMAFEGLELLAALQTLRRRPRVVCLHGGEESFEAMGSGLEILPRRSAAALGRRVGLTRRFGHGFATADFVDLCRLERASATLRFTYPPGPEGCSTAEIQIFAGEICNAFHGETSGMRALLAALPKYPDASLARRLITAPTERNVAAGFFTKRTKRNETMAKVNLERLAQIDGFIGACLVDWTSGMVLGAHGGGAINIEVAASGNSAVVKNKMQTIEALALDDSIEDILITLHKQYHLIRPLATSPELFIYLALDRKNANLALARHELKSFESSFSL